MSRETKAKAEQLRDFNSQVNSLVATGVKSLAFRIGEILKTREVITLSASTPWFNLASPDQTLDIVNFPYYIAYLRGLQGKLKWASTVLTGTVTVVAGTTDAAVTGSGTAFTSELSVGDLIFVAGQFRMVSAIASSTAMTLDEPITAAGGSSMWKITYGTSSGNIPLTHISRTSNVVSLYMNSTTAYPECYVMLSALAEDLALHGKGYTSWGKTLTLPVATGGVDAGTYAITAVTPANVGTASAVLTFTAAGDNIGSTATSEVVQFFPHRIAGSTTTARHSQITDAALMNDGLYNVAGLRGRDRMQGWQLGSSADASGARDYWGWNNSRDYLTGGVSGIPGFSLVEMQTTAQGVETMLKAMPNGTDGNVLTGPNTRPRFGAYNIYEYVRTYIAPGDVGQPPEVPEYEDEVSSATVQELYSATQYLLNELALYQSPSYLDLTAKLNATTPATQVDVAWAGLRIGNRYTTNQSFTLDITQSGALGLDTGSAANSTWYYIYAICNDAGSVVSAVMSASSAAPTLPSGYTKYRWISAVYRESTGAFRAYRQINNDIFYDTLQSVYSSSTSMGSEVEIDIAVWIPENTNRIKACISAQDYSSGGTSNTIATLKGNANGIYILQLNIYVVTSLNIYASDMQWGTVITDNRKLKWRAYCLPSTVSHNSGVACAGYEVPL